MQAVVLETNEEKDITANTNLCMRQIGDILPFYFHKK